MLDSEAYAHMLVPVIHIAHQVVELHTDTTRLGLSIIVATFLVILLTIDGVDLSGSLPQP